MHIVAMTLVPPSNISRWGVTRTTWEWRVKVFRVRLIRVPQPHWTTAFHWASFICKTWLCQASVRERGWVLAPVSSVWLAGWLSKDMVSATGSKSWMDWSLLICCGCMNQLCVLLLPTTLLLWSTHYWQPWVQKPSKTRNQLRTKWKSIYHNLEGKKLKLYEDFEKLEHKP